MSHKKWFRPPPQNVPSTFDYSTLKRNSSFWLCFFIWVPAAVMMNPGVASLICLFIIGAMLALLRRVAYTEGFEEAEALYIAKEQNKVVNIRRHFLDPRD